MFESVFSDLSIITVELVCTIFTISLLTWYLYYMYCFNYWKKKGVPTHSPQFPAGNITKSLLGKENIFITMENLYKEFKSKGYKHGGVYFFNGPVYLPVDSEIIKSILVTNFDHFVDRGMYVNEDKFPISANLFSITGNKWKTLRTKLSPAFSSGKLKNMYKIFLKTTESYIDTVRTIAEKEGEMNIKYVTTNFTADIISSTALGLDANTLKNPGNEISKITYSIFHPSDWLFLETVIMEGLHNPGTILRAVASNKKVETFFMNLVRDTINYRTESKIIREDLLSLILDIQAKEGLSFNEVVAQCFLFFLAGFETTAQTISYCIHELSHNQELQEKLRQEIHNNLGKDYTKYGYEDIMKLPYLDKVFNETLRLYPVLGFLNRICVKQYKVPGTDLVLDEGTHVLISTLGFQHDPDYFSDPLKFDPERFSEEEHHTPFTFLPFGDGPRFCIGMRYGKLQAKLGIAALISQFKFTPSPKTPRRVELDKLVKSLVMFPKKGLIVKVSKL